MSRSLKDESRMVEERKMKRGGGNWIQGAIKHPGALRSALHVPKGRKIPKSKMLKALHSRNPLLKKQANLANTLSGFNR